MIMESNRTQRVLYSNTFNIILWELATAIYNHERMGKNLKTPYEIQTKLNEHQNQY